MYSRKKKIPRGIRNNNPLNIRIGNDWKGEVENPTDSQFEQFKTMTWGVRAAFIVLYNYIVRRKVNMIALIINRWAPTNENDTLAYMKQVSKISKIGLYDPIDFYDRESMVKLFKGMCMVENGCIIDEDDIYLGYDLVVANRPKSKM